MPPKQNQPITPNITQNKLNSLEITDSFLFNEPIMTSTIEVAIREVAIREAKSGTPVTNLEIGFSLRLFHTQYSFTPHRIWKG